MALQWISQEHHQTLEFCWRIRKAMSNSIDYQRIIDYVEWFYNVHLNAHFMEEEKYIFPILGGENKIIQRALSEHRKLKRLFEKRTEPAKYITRIEEALESHIRFEEHVLLAKVKEVSSEEDFFKILPTVKNNEKREEWADPFWEK